VASVNEERLNRQKLSTGFPTLSIPHVLDVPGISPDAVDRIFFADRHGYYKPDSTYWRGWLIDHPSLRKATMANVSSAISSVVGNHDWAQSGYYALKRRVTAKRRPTVEARMQPEYGLRAPVQFVDHHFCHVTAAYYTAGFPSATVITLDGGGDGLCSRAYRVRDGAFEDLNALRSYHSIGNYYAYVTKLCGFTAHKHEGKITGRAAYGKPIYMDDLSKMIGFADGNIQNTGNAYYWSAVNKLKRLLPENYKREDLAASIQTVLENVVVAYVRHWVRESGVGDVALAGGVFANVRLNQKIHELPEVDRIFVHPGMGDEGLSFGAALPPSAAGETFPDVIDDVYLGAGYSDEDIEDALRNRGLEFTRAETLETDIAELLSQGYVVARFDGRMEYGPRALGNRSILYQPNDPSANDWLNKHLHRTEFMPFAPAVAIENAERCFQRMSGAEHTSRFMTITFDCTPEMAKLCPGVTHVDGTARPQVVREQDNPSYYRIIREYERITGIPSIVNTSFNVHDEPIVCTPDDAVNGFVGGDLDYLAIGSFLVAGKNAQNRRRIIHEVGVG
jgi:carbamoyltransferase